MFLTKHFLLAAIYTMILWILLGGRTAAALQECAVIDTDNIQLIEPLRVLHFPKTDKYHDPLTDFSWMPDSGGFAVAAGDSGLWSYLLNDMKNPQVSNQEPIFRVRFDPTGRLRATIGEGNIKILNQETSASLEAEPSQGTLSFLFSPDGSRLYYERGEVRVLGVAAREFSQPVVTARSMGRYAIELWIGHELVDRVRFD